HWGSGWGGACARPLPKSWCQRRCASFMRPSRQRRPKQDASIAIPPRRGVRYKLFVAALGCCPSLAVTRERGLIEGLVKMDFTLSPEIEDLRQRTRAFIEQNV